MTVNRQQSNRNQDPESKAAPKGLTLKQKLFRLKKVGGLQENDNLNQDENQFKVRYFISFGPRFTRHERQC